MVLKQTRNYDERASSTSTMHGPVPPSGPGRGTIRKTPFEPLMTSQVDGLHSKLVKLNLSFFLGVPDAPA